MPLSGMLLKVHRTKDAQCTRTARHNVPLHHALTKPLHKPVLKGHSAKNGTGLIPNNCVAHSASLHQPMFQTHSQQCIEHTSGSLKQDIECSASENIDHGRTYKSAQQQTAHH
jgi:hypothetical protein